MENHHAPDGKGGADAPLSILGKFNDQHNQIALVGAQRVGLDVLTGAQFRVPVPQVAQQVMDASGNNVRLWRRLLQHPRHDADELILSSARVMASGRDLLEGDGADQEFVDGMRQALNTIIRSGLAADMVINWNSPESLDDSSWIHQAAQVAPVIIWRPVQLMRVLAERLVSAEKSSATHEPAQLHPGQKQAISFLENLMQARFEGIQAGGIRIQGHGFVMGSSGSGKSFLARELAHRSNADLHQLTIGSWLLIGDDRPHATLNLIARWIRSLKPGRKGILFIDEIDKMEATNGDNHNAIYVRSCFDELLALLDGRADAPSWDESIQARFRKDVFVIGAGAFQSLYQTDGEITLEEEWEEISAAETIWEAGILPAELLMRLAPGAVEIPPPNAKWLATKLQQIDVEIHGGLQLSAEQYLRKAGEMVRSKRNLRSVESYVLEAWTKKKQTQVSTPSCTSPGSVDSSPDDPKIKPLAAPTYL